MSVSTSYKMKTTFSKAVRSHFVKQYEWNPVLQKCDPDAQELCLIFSLVPCKQCCRIPLPHEKCWNLMSTKVALFGRPLKPPLFQLEVGWRGESLILQRDTSLYKAWTSIPKSSAGLYQSECTSQKWNFSNLPYCYTCTKHCRYVHFTVNKHLLTAFHLTTKFSSLGKQSEQ